VSETDLPDAEVVGYSPDPLFALAYVSIPTVPFSDADLSGLLLAARRWNAHYGVTGKLIVLEEGDRVSRFAQWIEGPESALKACFRRITDDPRHEGIDVRFRGPVAARQFPSWDMAIEDATTDSFDGMVADLTRDGKSEP
jgi:hypothetical protein